MTALGRVGRFGRCGRVRELDAVSEVREQLFRRFRQRQVEELGGEVDHVSILSAAEAVEPIVQLHAGVVIVVEGTQGHPMTVYCQPIVPPPRGL